MVVILGDIIAASVEYLCITWCMNAVTGLGGCVYMVVCCSAGRQSCIIIILCLCHFRMKNTHMHKCTFALTSISPQLGVLQYGVLLTICNVQLCLQVWNNVVIQL